MKIWFSCLLTLFFYFREINLPSQKRSHELNGGAAVQVFIDGAKTGYHITANDIQNCSNNLGNTQQ